MTRIRSIYLDTSVISALFDDRTPERKRFTYEFWEKLENYRVSVSTVVAEEINATSEELREKMMAKISGFEIRNYCPTGIIKKKRFCYSAPALKVQQMKTQTLMLL